MKNIWILNHYATNMFFNKGGRHYWFAKFLIKKGYKVTIFCASSFYITKKNLINNNEKYIEKNLEGVKFVFVKVRSSIGNGKDRIMSMLDYYNNLKKVANNFKKPDVIIGSSVHPLACIAALKLSKKYKCMNIVEIRDLWPLTLVEYGRIKKNSLLARIMYLGEKWIYRKADTLIFTMEGGKEYIKDQGWDRIINLNKVYHINNGVDLEEFDNNKNKYKLEDDDLSNEKLFKVIYTGSINLANNIKKVVKVAEKLKEKKMKNIKILIYGSGIEKEKLENYCKEKKLENIIFKGQIEKKYIPYILSKGNLNLMHYRSSCLLNYGFSLNKSFEYLASGKPILIDTKSNFDYIQSNGAGIITKNDLVDTITDSIIKFYSMPKLEYEKYGKNARLTSKSYDFRLLTNKLVNIIEDTKKRGN